MPTKIERKLGHIGRFGIAFVFAVEACSVVAHLGVDRLDGAGERLGLDQQMRWDNFAVSAPSIGRHREWLQMRDARQKPLQCFVYMIAHFHGKDASCGAKHSNP